MTICEAHWLRAAVRVPAEFTVAGSGFCQSCFRGGDPAAPPRTKLSRDEDRAYRRAKRQARGESVRKYHRRYYLLHRDRLVEVARQYRQRHREELRLKQKARRDAQRRKKEAVQ